MSRINNFLQQFGFGRTQQSASAERQRAVIRPKTSARARVSSEDGVSFSSLRTIVAPREPEQDWRTLDLSDETLRRVSMRELVRLLADLSPEISSALYHFVLFGNAGYELMALNASGEQDARAQAALDAFTDVLADEYGTLDSVFDRLLANAFVGGAFSAELVLDRTGRRPVDLVVIDPRSFRYKRVQDPDRGPVWQLGQYNMGEWVALNIPTVRYVPIHPLGDPPYGRPLISPAIFVTMFLIGLLRDLRRVVAQQGYNRDDVAIDTEILRDMMPEEIEDQSNEYREWIASAISQVTETIQRLEPDDTYIHTHAISVNKAASDSGGLVGNTGGVAGLITALERMAVRALKTQPLLMGINEATSETHANRQWEIHAAGIDSMQDMLESMLEHLFKQALRVQGIQATVKLEFKTLRASERFRDAQTEGAEIANAFRKYELGIISHQQMANELGYSSPDQAAPRTEQGAAPVVAPAQDERKAILDRLWFAMDKFVSSEVY